VSVLCSLYPLPPVSSAPSTLCSLYPLLPLPFAPEHGLCTLLESSRRSTCRYSLHHLYLAAAIRRQRATPYPSQLHLTRNPSLCNLRKFPVSILSAFIAHTSLQTLLSRRPSGSKSHIALFGSFDPSQTSYHPEKGRVIDDPYYGGKKGFDACYEQCCVYADGFLDYVKGDGR